MSEKAPHPSAAADNSSTTPEGAGQDDEHNKRARPSAAAGLPGSMPDDEPQSKKPHVEPTSPQWNAPEVVECKGSLFISCLKARTWMAQSTLSRKFASVLVTAADVGVHTPSTLGSQSGKYVHAQARCALVLSANANCIS